MTRPNESINDLSEPGAGKSHLLPAEKFTFNELMHHLRYFKNRDKYNKKTLVYNKDANALPKFTKSLDAAQWIRDNGYHPLTNDTFRFLMTDLLGKTISEEEYVTARILTSPVAYLLRDCEVEGFITFEEQTEFEIYRNKGFLGNKIAQCIETILGTHLSFIEPSKKLD